MSMSSSITLIVTFTLLAVLCQAEPPRFLTSRRNGAIRTNIRFLARQEAADAPTTIAPGPYPPAGVTPETPFELPTETEAPLPDQTYGPPDQTYGPPDQTYGPPPAQPHEVYGPPPQTQPQPNVEPVVQENSAAPNSNLVLQKLILPGTRPARFRPQPIRFIARPIKQAPRPLAVEIIHSEPVFRYTLHN